MANIAETIKSFFSEDIVGVFRTFGLRDALDILLLSGALFVIYRFFHKRRAGRIFVGIAVIMVLCAVVAALQFPALTYIVRLLGDFALFSVIVIFSPEIRDGLETLGNSTFLNPGSNGIRKKRYSLAENVAKETVDAVMDMSESKTGALIIFEGMTGLGDYTKSGKILDASLSAPLLETIFFENTALHDGAVVVRNLRIYAASCVLPSTKQTRGFGNMGTRHRAAVGVTEVSDALAITVSEQTGTVSVANAGRLLRGVSRETLLDILMTFLAGNAYLKKKKVVLDGSGESLSAFFRSVGVSENEKVGKGGKTK